MKSVIVYPPNAAIKAEIMLAASKSETNRALIIDALTGFKCQLSNISEARDSQTMQRLLNEAGDTADVIDAGTTMRFLTAFFTVTGRQKIMTGTPRMCERPIGILAEALKSMGGKIEYADKEGYPPLRISGFEYNGNHEVTVPGNVSSQYISALLLVAPFLPEGLNIRIEGEVGSKPYIEMTLQQMAQFGIQYNANWQEQLISVPAQAYSPTSYQIESDWSGASYWYSVVALAPSAEVELLGLKKNSLQGDSAIVKIMDHLGVESTFTERGVLLTKKVAAASLSWDFTDCPDLAQTVAVCCAMKNIHLYLTGIESLKIKETDRVLALQQELKKLGAELREIKPDESYEVRSLSPLDSDVVPVIETYDDHRMAMAFAPVGMIRPVEILEPGVVVKSYPKFWNDLEQVTVLDQPVH